MEAASAKGFYKGGTRPLSEREIRRMHAGGMCATEIMRDRRQVDLDRVSCAERSQPMITERGRPDYPLPDDLFEVHSLALSHGRHRTTIAVISPKHMQTLRLEQPAILGIPTLASVYGERLWLYPAPDAAYSIKVVYLPSPRVF